MLANREIIARKIGTMQNVSLNEARKMVDNVLLAIEDLTKTDISVLGYILLWITILQNQSQKNIITCLQDKWNMLK